MPPGLTAKIAGVPLCAEAKANAGTCGPESQIGTSTVLVGSGTHPLFQEGKVYLTGPYKGQPFGLSIVVPAVAGPYNLGQVVVRSAIHIDENTAAVTVSSDPIPQILDGIPLRIRKVNVNIDREDFELNPTNCQSQAITATLTSAQNVVHSASSHFDVGACGALSFTPAFGAQSESKTSRTEGAALTVTINQKPGESDIKRVNVQLPKALPSRLTTLQHACTQAQFSANPNGCPEQSVVGSASAKTPLLHATLAGKAILVSRGAQFPDLDFLLEGEGIKINLVGHTEIKNGITYSKFETVPDQPIESFTTSFPRGPHSILAANGNLCTQALEMPTTIEGQNGALMSQTTKVAVSGCAKPLTNAQKLKQALKACRKKDKHHRKRRRACERKAHKRFATKASKSSANGAQALHALAAAASQGLGQTALAFSQAIVAPVTPASAPVQTQGQQGSCPNQARIAESNIDPATHEPYSATLPECRAYELVSPQEKQGHDVSEVTAISPSGEAVGYTSEGNFGEPSNFYLEGVTVRNSFVSRRGSNAGAPQWSTETAFAPAGVVNLPNLEAPAASDFSPALSGGAQIACGVPPTGGYVCAARAANGSWSATPTYWPTQGLGTITPSRKADMGQSADLARAFIEPGLSLLTQDHLERRRPL